MNKDKVLDILLYILCTIFPIVSLIIGLVYTYYLSTFYGYDKETHLWDINATFQFALFGLIVTIVVTYSIILVSNLLSSFVEKKR